MSFIAPCRVSIKLIRTFCACWALCPTEREFIPEKANILNILTHNIIYLLPHGGNSLQMWKESLNVLNKKSTISGKGWASSLAIEREPKIPHRKNIIMLWTITESLWYDGILCLLRTGSIGWILWTWYQIFGSIKGGGFLDQPRAYKLFKNFVPRSLFVN